MGLVGRTNLFLTPTLVPKVIRNLRDFDIVHLNEIRTFQNAIIHYYAKRWNIPYVIHAQGQFPFNQKKRQEMKKAYDLTVGYRLLHDASGVIASNQHESREFKQIGIDEKLIGVLPNGIDLSLYRTLPTNGLFKEKFGIGKDKKIILFIGRIAYQKGVDILIEAYGHLVKKLGVNDSVLVIAGSDGGCLYEIQNLIKASGLKDRIILTGLIEGSAKMSAYVDADCCVLPSRFEAFPMSALEACAFGKPLIGSRIEGLDEVLDQVGGIMFTRNNVEELAECLADILLNSEKAKKIGQHSKELVEKKFTIEKVVDQIEAFYKEVINRKLS
jgi:glycosyltransferase involved in cell wall biosynthesis